MTDCVASPIRSVLRHLEPAALRPTIRYESRARQRHLPPISVYRWWARRTETLTGAIIEAISKDQPGRLLIADTFAGGGVIALAALLRGHQVYAQDINPWAARSLTTMLDLPTADELSAASDRLYKLVADQLTDAYSTAFDDGTPATIAHTLRVATTPCPRCHRTLRLFPTGLVSLLTRVDRGGTDGYLACPAGHLNLASVDGHMSCATCGRNVDPTARYTASRATRCAECGWSGKLAELVGEHGFEWEIALVERTAIGRREIGPPSDADLNVATAVRWTPKRELGPIDPGIETAVLLRHGMSHWHDLYPARQRVVIEALFDACRPASNGDEKVRQALEAAVIGSTEMAGHGSRWDARYLKPYEAVANHRFNFTTLAAEPNVWGAPVSGRGTVDRRLEHLAKASVWFAEHVGRALHVQGPELSTARRTAIAARVDARVVAGSSRRLSLPANSVDAVVTDPPYHDDVHYGELSDLFRAWVGQCTGALAGDAIVRQLTGRTDGTATYEAVLTEVFIEIRRVLRPGGHLVLSYANRHPGAWVALFNALQGAGFQTVGYTVVHSENEVDHAKAGRRACTLDVLLDLVAANHAEIQTHQPCHEPESDQDAFCHFVGRWASRIGELPDDWAHEFTIAARTFPFLN